jgi:hypothetical protein
MVFFVFLTLLLAIVEESKDIIANDDLRMLVKPQNCCYG